MKSRLAAYAVVLALSTVTTIAAQAASRSSAADDQRANQITDQLNRQQLSGDSQASMSQDIQQPQPAAGMTAQPTNDTMQPQTAQQPDREQMPHSLTNFRSFQ